MKDRQGTGYTERLGKVTCKRVIYISDGHADWESIDKIVQGDSWTGLDQRNVLKADGLTDRSFTATFNLLESSHVLQLPIAGIDFSRSYTYSSSGVSAASGRHLNPSGSGAVGTIG